MDSHYCSTNDNSYHRQQPTNNYNNYNHNSNSTNDATHLLTNPRTRIATISSGYKKANFFVREDLDTRIYFHQLEDAIGYMAKRGYCKMRGGEEREWRDLLGRAHGVVKIGPKKEKQRYRKGKLVMILKKTITDHNDNDNINNKKKTKEDQLVVRQTKKKKKKKKKKQSSSSSNDNDSFASQSQATGRSISSHTTTTDNDNSFASGASEYTSPSQANTDRTSLGKSVRGPYKSYSEKFLAEQEEEKRRVMLAIVEGRPLPDDVIGYSNMNSNNGYANGNGAGRQLLLTDGNTGSSTAASGPTDPDADITSQHLSSCQYSNDNEDEDGGTRSGTSTMYTYGDTTTRASSSTYGETATSTTVNSEDFKKSQATMVSNGRRGVYGGGVRYFTPDNGQDDDDDEEGDDGSSSSDEEESGEEETMMSDDEDFEEEDTYDAYEDHIEVDNDDDEDDEERSGVIEHDEDEVNSMFSEESSSYDYNRTAGVDSVTSGCNDDDTVVSDVSKYSHNDSVKGMRKNKGRRSPPAMDGISDEDEDSR